jgi:diguanylate cyclase (GGDEF)-like protein
MSFNAGAIKAIRDRDREELLRVFASMCDHYGVGYFTITDHEGIALARTHDPNLFGDSVLYQQNVKDALNGNIQSYFEAGTYVRVSVRTGAPVYDTDGSLLGVISAGIRFDLDSEAERLKQLFQAEIAIFSLDTRIATTTRKDGRSIVEPTLDPNIVEMVIKNKQKHIDSVNIFGERYKTYYKPLLDSQDEVFAVFFFGMPTTELVAASNHVSRDGFIFGLVGLIISIMLIYVIMSSISEPIISLSKNMSHIANGNLRVDIKIKSEDEVGHLARSLQRVADILQKLLDDISIMIAEHKKGNTDYNLNAEVFRGDYRILVDSVLELASFSLQDQLTGIPNRRSFDNRLDLEWNRAMRDKTPISCLMMDIDKFKTYNDTFGHQQGDITLQTIAHTINQSINRSTDFAARWGGEEFVVLLPNTDSSGATSVAETIRTAIEKADVPCDDERGRRATISIGVHTHIPGRSCSIDEFVSAADGALYKAKKAGRNRVCHHAH